MCNEVSDTITHTMWCLVCQFNHIQFSVIVVAIVVIIILVINVVTIVFVIIIIVIIVVAISFRCCFDALF